MRTLYIIIAITSIALSVNAQDLKESQVPDAVKTKFSLLYPDIKNISWEKENNYFEAEFKQNEMEISAIFDVSANLIQTETEISVSSLPAGVSDYVSKNLEGEKISEAEKIIDAKGIVTYEAEIGNADYMFDSNGNFQKIEKENTDDNDEED